MNFMFTNVNLPMTTFAKEFGMTLLVATLENISICDFELFLAGIELIFCIVASMGLYFGFVLKTVLIIQGCFHFC